MIVEVKLYKQFDTDLVALFDDGYPLNNMIRQALIAYANGYPLFYAINTPRYFDMNGKKTVRMRIKIKDKNAIHVIKNIKHRYRNSFCKCVLRNALIQQNVSCFFADQNLMSLQFENAKHFPVPEYKNVIMFDNGKMVEASSEKLASLFNEEGQQDGFIPYYKRNETKGNPDIKGSKVVSETKKVESLHVEENHPVKGTEFPDAVLPEAKAPAPEDRNISEQGDVDEDALLEAFDKL